MLKNQMLQQAMTHVESGVKDRASYDKIVKAGTNLIYNKDVFPEITRNLGKSKDPVADVAMGIVGVLAALFEKSRHTMPKVPMLQAGMALLIDALDFIEQAGLVVMDKPLLAKATKEYTEHIMHNMGLSPEKMNAMLVGVRPILADPKRMAQYKASLGGARL